MTDASADDLRIKRGARVQGAADDTDRAARRALRQRQLEPAAAGNGGPAHEAPAAFSDAQRELAALLALKNDRSAGRGRFRTTIEGVRAILSRHPDFSDACVAHLTLLREAERLEGAKRLAEQYRQQFPHDSKLLLVHAAILDDLKDFAGALALISELRAVSPPAVAIECAYIKALAQSDRLQDADAACIAALEAFPDDVRLLRQYANLAMRGGDWNEAVRRWEDAANLWPDNALVKRSLDRARQHVADQQPASAEIDTGDSGRFFARFESLGGDVGGCEFGFVQRKFGSSSLSLLRWSNVSVEALTEGMQSGFQGLGEIGNTELRTFKQAPDREEYRVWDAKYGLFAHTFISTTEAPADKVLQQTVRRLTYLKGKLLEELGTAKKVFVYKIGNQSPTPVDDAVMRAIFAGARQYGAVTLMCVLKEDAGHPAGSVRKIEDSLYVGYVKYFMYAAPGREGETIDYQAWQTICTDVLARHDAAA